MIHHSPTLVLLSELLSLKYSGALACHECFPVLSRISLMYEFISIPNGCIIPALMCITINFKSLSIKISGVSICI